MAAAGTATRVDAARERSAVFRQEHDPCGAASDLSDESVIAEHVANHWNAGARNVMSAGQKWESSLMRIGKILAAAMRGPRC